MSTPQINAIMKAFNKETLAKRYTEMQSQVHEAESKYQKAAQETVRLTDLIGKLEIDKKRLEATINANSNHTKKLISDMRQGNINLSKKLSIARGLLFQEIDAKISIRAELLPDDDENSGGFFGSLEKDK